MAAFFDKPIKQKRGFALMDREQVRKNAKRGGMRAHKLGKAHKFTHEEAVKAGRLGGLAKAALQK